MDSTMVVEAHVRHRRLPQRQTLWPIGFALPGLSMIPRPPKGAPAIALQPLWEPCPAHLREVAVWHRLSAL